MDMCMQASMKGMEREEPPEGDAACTCFQEQVKVYSSWSIQRTEMEFFFLSIALTFFSFCCAIKNRHYTK
jgi:hypothetical protein